MSELERLIQELCPNGVEYCCIGDICDTITDYTAAGSFADIAKNVQYINNGKGFAQLIRTTDLKNNFNNEDRFVYVNEHAFNYLWRVNLNEEALVMPNVGNCGEVYYITADTFPSKHNVLGPNAILVKSTKANVRFLYHLFLASEFQKNLAKIVSPVGQTKFNKTNFKTLKIPVPPIEVQGEIVRILDNFTELTLELTKEHSARNKQYEYYSDVLFELPTAERVPITDIAFTYIGLVTTMTKHYVPDGVRLIHNSSIKRNRFEFKEDVFLDEPFALQNDNRRHKIGDVVTVHTGDVGTSAIIDETLDGSLGFATIVSRVYDTETILPQYLCYYLNSYTNKRNIESMTKSDRSNLNLKDFNKLCIPLPSIEEQKRIIRILDNFDTLCNKELPAEIEARQKQYEYYRDKLLTFKEASE